MKKILLRSVIIFGILLLIVAISYAGYFESNPLTNVIFGIVYTSLFATIALMPSVLTYGLGSGFAIIFSINIIILLSPFIFFFTGISSDVGTIPGYIYIIMIAVYLCLLIFAIVLYRKVKG